VRSNLRLAVRSDVDSFAATAIVTLVSMWYIYRKMTAVRKKVLIGMREDLVAHGDIYVSQVPKQDLTHGRDEAVGQSSPF
jgi:hypothetical protein